jgi:hypothetical protein
MCNDDEFQEGENRLPFPNFYCHTHFFFKSEYMAQRGQIISKIASQKFVTNVRLGLVDKWTSGPGYIGPGSAVVGLGPQVRKFGL